MPNPVESPIPNDLPVLAQSAWLEGDHLVVVDETALPNDLVLIEVHDCAKVVEVIREMKTRGFGQLLCVLYTMLMTAERHAVDTRVRQAEALASAAAMLGSARATFPLNQLSRQALEVAERIEGSSEAVAQALRDRIEGFVSRTQGARRARANQVAERIPPNATVLTHCNMSGELVLIGRACRALGKAVEFIATETRPYFQGSRLTAWELMREGFALRLIADSAVGHVMAKKMVDAVVVASDHSAANGDIANKVGTYQIAILARHFGIPFYVFSQPSSMFATGRDIPIEERNPDELLTFRGKRIAPDGVLGYYPAFDITPSELITERFTVHVPRNVLGS